jgi:predicted phosphodiesterase
MKYAVISDIHGNLEALNAVIDRAEAEGVDRYVCVGDIVGYNANPAECLEIVQSLDLAAIVRGNHDEYAGNDDNLGAFNANAANALMWTRQQLTTEQKKWLKQLELVEVTDKDGITVVHATLDSPISWGYIYDKYHATDNISYQSTQFCFCGHSHVPVLFRQGFSMETHNVCIEEIKDWERCAENETSRSIIADFGCKYLVNVGSIGQPRNGDSRASFVIYDAGMRILKRVCVEYDIAAAQEKIRRAGLPEKLALRLERGC